MMRVIVNSILVGLVLWLSAALAAQAEPTLFQPIELDSTIDIGKAQAERVGKKIILNALPVSFNARMKRQPEQQTMAYIYTALGIVGMEPLPVVEHRMFVESDGGNIIAVYVEKNAVQLINQGLKENQRARFDGYHIYNYARGPAIMVVGFKAEER